VSEQPFEDSTTVDDASVDEATPETEEAVAAPTPEAEEPAADGDPPAIDALEARLEVDEETEATDLDQAARTEDAVDVEEAEAPGAEPQAASPVELPDAVTAEVLETADVGGLQEPDEERIEESPPEVAEEIEEPAVGTADEIAATPEPVEVEEPAEEVAAAESADKAAVAAVAEAEPEEPTGRDPFRGPGDWYVVHTYAGYENKVKANLESRIGSMQMQDKIFEVEIPMEDVMEIKGGKKQVVQKKVFPGYLLVKMIYDNDSWYVVRNTPGVTGFVSSGTGTKPTPLSKREVEKILTVPKQEVKPQFRLEFEEGDVVRIISGPFADFNGTVDEINVDQSKLKVLVNIFDRETPVELGFDQVAKV
jgi:transcription termination/antitermination protein NusG